MENMENYSYTSSIHHESSSYAFSLISPILCNFTGYNQKTFLSDLLSVRTHIEHAFFSRAEQEKSTQVYFFPLHLAFLFQAAAAAAAAAATKLTLENAKVCFMQKQQQQQQQQQQLLQPGTNSSRDRRSCKTRELQLHREREIEKKKQEKNEEEDLGEK